MKIEITKIEGSSNICGAGYDPESRTLAVDFGDKGRIYHYADVPKELYEEFLSAESKGKFFASEIRGKFKSEKQPSESESTAAQAAS